MHTRNFKFDSIVKRRGNKFVKRVCVIGQVESQIDLSLVCVSTYWEVNSPHALLYTGCFTTIGDVSEWVCFGVYGFLRQVVQPKRN